MINLSLPPDKANHFFWGSVIGLAAYGFTGYTWDPTWAAEIGTAVATAVGFGKERVDAFLNKRAVKEGRAEPHGVEWLDWVMTGLGGAAVNGVSIFNHLVK